MGRAKDIIIKVLPSSIANEFIKKNHYSGKVVNNSQLHFGAFLDGGLHGVLSLGPCLDKKKMIGLVRGTDWNGFLELNRMAFDERLPKNSESRCISIALRLLKKNAPHIKWIISFADATQCGDGTIYRASGFKLIGVKENNRLLKLPDGTITHGLNLSLRGSPSISAKYNPKLLPEKQAVKMLGAKYLDGFQIKYIYFLDQSKQKDLTVPILPFSEIDKMGAGMYKGEKISITQRRVKSIESRCSCIPAEEGGANPTLTHLM